MSDYSKEKDAVYQSVARAIERNERVFIADKLWFDFINAGNRHDDINALKHACINHPAYSGIETDEHSQTFFFGDNEGISITIEGIWFF